MILNEKLFNEGSGDALQAGEVFDEQLYKYFSESDVGYWGGLIPTTSYADDGSLVMTVRFGGALPYFKVVGIDAYGIFDLAKSLVDSLNSVAKYNGVIETASIESTNEYFKVSIPEKVYVTKMPKGTHFSVNSDEDFLKKFKFARKCFYKKIPLDDFNEMCIEKGYAEYSDEYLHEDAPMKFEIKTDNFDELYDKIVRGN